MNAEASVDIAKSNRQTNIKFFLPYLSANTPSGIPPKPHPMKKAELQNTLMIVLSQMRSN